jgi:iron(III) transport system substrate-binding protein
LTVLPRYRQWQKKADGTKKTMENDRRIAMKGEAGLNRRAFLHSAIGMVALVAAPDIAFAAEEAALAVAAKKEGSGTIYTSSDPKLTADLTGAFRAKYDIPIEIQRLPSGPLGQRLATEVDNKAVLADVVMTFDKRLLQDGYKKGWFAEVKDLPALAKWPAAGIWNNVGFNIAPDVYNLAWNSSLVTTPPSGWRDLIDPKWKGQVMLSDPRAVTGPTQGWFWLMRKAFGDDFLKALGRNAKYSPSQVPGMQQLAAGATAFYAPGSTSAIDQVIVKGAPVKRAVFQPTIQYESFAIIPAAAPHPAVARLFLNYWLTPEAQALYNKDGYSLLANVPGVTPLPAAELSDENAVHQQLPEILALLGIN